MLDQECRFCFEPRKCCYSSEQYHAYVLLHYKLLVSSKKGKDDDKLT